jgi:hypothetical protein
VSRRCPESVHRLAATPKPRPRSGPLHTRQAVQRVRSRAMGTADGGLDHEPIAVKLAAGRSLKICAEVSESESVAKVRSPSLVAGGCCCTFRGGSVAFGQSRALTRRIRRPAGRRLAGQDCARAPVPAMSPSGRTSRPADNATNAARHHRPHGCQLTPRLELSPRTKRATGDAGDGR